jgi:hypothetical protein
MAMRAECEGFVVVHWYHGEELVPWGGASTMEEPWRKYHGGAMEELVQQIAVTLQEE